MVQRCEDQDFWPFTYGYIMAATAPAIIVQMEEELLPSKIASFEELSWKSYPTTLLINYF